MERGPDIPSPLAEILGGRPAHHSREASAPQPTSSHWYDFLEQEYVNSVGEESNGLDEMLRKQREQLRTNTTNLISISQVMQSGLFQGIVTCLWIAQWILLLMTARRHAETSGIAFRFSAVGDQNDLSALSSFRMLSECEAVPPLNQSFAFKTVTVTYSEPVGIDGWSFDLKSTGAAPAALLAERKIDEQHAFQPLTRSSTVCPHWPVPSRLEGSERIQLSLGEQETLSQMTRVALLLGLGVVILFCRNHRILMARRTLACMLLCLTALSIGGSVISVGRGDDDVALRSGKAAVLRLVLAAVVELDAVGQRFGGLCAGVGALTVLGEIAALFVEVCGQRGAGMDLVELTLGVCLLGLGLGMLALLWRQLVQAQERRQLYSVRFDAVWEQVLSEEGAREQLAALEVQCGSVRRSTKLQQGFPLVASPTRQSRTFPFKASESARGSEQPEKAAAVVRRLGQLYALASATQEVLRRKVETLAAAHGGLVPLTPRKRALEGEDQMFVRWAAASAEQRRAVAWTPLKPPERAVDQVLLAHGGQVAKVLDVSRESLVFDNVAELRACLTALLNDSELQVLRVHNSMDFAGGGGIRQVEINLRFCGGAACALGVQRHICELRLLLLSVAVCLTEELHEPALRGLSEGRRATQRRSRGLQLVRDASLTSPPSSPVAAAGGSSPCMSVQLLPASPSRSSFCSNAETSLLGAQPRRASLAPPPLPVAGPAELDVGLSAGVAGETRHPERESLRAESSRRRASFSLLGRSESSEEWSREGVPPTPGGEEWPTELGSRPPQAQWSGRLPPEVLLEQYRVRALLQGPEEVHEGAPTLRESVDQCSVVSIFSTSFPIAAAMRRRLFPAVFVVFFCLQLMQMISWPGELAPTEHATHLRFTALELRDPAARPTAAIIEGLGLRYRGCGAIAREALVEVEESADHLEYLVAFDAPVLFDEVVFSTARDSPPASDPARYTVEASEDGSEWRLVAASRRLLQPDGTVWFDSEPALLPAERGREVALSLAATWRIGQKPMLVALGCFAWLIAALSMLGLYQYGRPAFLTMGLTCALCQLHSAVQRTVLGEYNVFPTEFITGLGFLTLGSTVYLRETLVVESMVFISVLHLAVTSFQSVVLDNNAQYLKRPFFPLSILFVLVLWFKRRNLKAAFANVAPDMAQYDAAWAAVCADPRQLEACRRLAAVLRSANSHHGRLRQLYRPREDLGVPAAQHTRSAHTSRMRSAESEEGAGASAAAAPHPSHHEQLALGLKGRASSHRRQPVSTLGLLYRQAAGVYCLALRRLQAWSDATAAGAMLPVKRSGQPAELLQLKGARCGSGGGEDGSEEKWECLGGAEADGLPPLKGLQRASQKLMRSYAADASRLLDVCRFSLVCDNAWELTDLVEVILSDPDVEVMGIKNRLRDDVDARASAGFRDVHLNLRMAGADARRLGIDTHVWELQMMLSSIWRLRTDGGHSRYVAYRNMRAE